MTKEEALEVLRKEFHKTRLTQKIYIDPEVIAAILGYPSRRKYNGWGE